jgi:putative tricarboxylic transport membrane protein
MKPESHAPEMGSKPWWLGASIIALGAFWLYGAFDLDITATYSGVGPGMFVMLVGAAIVVLGIILLAQIALGERFESQDAEDTVAGASAHWPALLTAIVGASIPLYTMERFGFALSAALMFALITRAFGSQRLVIDLIIGAALGALVWWGFTGLGVTLGDVVRVPSPVELLPEFLRPRSSS